jgi:tetratricopeptide (TPR) repeat protein
MSCLYAGILAILIAAAGGAALAAEPHRTEVAPNAAEPLFDNLGTWHRQITTKAPQAQRYFDQGLRLIYAFNHEEAIRSFEEAARLDPDAAMAYWGIAYALGPNINAPMDRNQEGRAAGAVEQARRRGPQVSPRERAYIEALAKRYSTAPDADRHALDQAYADAMRQVYQDDPADTDGATMYAEALMDLRPWDYWTEDGQPRPGTMDLVNVLETVLKKHPDHPGACHYYIHAVEAWQPQRALACAERLPGLAPGAGHLVHMPSHIYIRLGMYDKAAERNVHAASVDRHYLEGRTLPGPYPVGYYPHNIHFLWAAQTMQGRSADAMKTARDLMKVVSLDVVRQVPEMEFHVPTPVLAMARFGDWDGILREPSPAADLAYTMAIWRYARGLAMTAKGQLDEARQERKDLDEIGAAMSPERTVGLNSARTLLTIASHVLGGQIEAKQGRVPEAVRQFEEAVRLQDGLRYFEPPDWYYPVRESLGAVLLNAGRAQEAERVFREDLKRTPENPWSLRGLADALRAQRSDREAASVEERLRRASSHADVDFKPARSQAFLAR